MEAIKNDYAIRKKEINDYFFILEKMDKNQVKIEVKEEMKNIDILTYTTFKASAIIFKRVFIENRRFY